MPQKPTPPTKASPRIGIPAHQPLDIIGNLQAIQQAASRPQPQAIFGLNDPNSVVGQMANVGNTILDYTVKPVNARPAETVDWSKFGQVPQGMPRFETVQPMVAPTVYHGSPHFFDMFDMSKIGTGEGAQAYGHGLYFAESPTVAKSYQMAGPRQVWFDGAPLKLPSNWASEPEAIAKHKLLIHQSVNDAFNDLDEAYRVWAHPPANQENVQMYGDAIDWLKANQHRFEIKPKGGFYETHIPDEVADKMLHWDKRMEQQPKPIHGAIDKLIEDFRLNDVSSYSTGNDLYHTLARASVFNEATQTLDQLGTKGASEELAKRGIPGIQYFDQMSRNAQKGTRNFVVFDTSILGPVSRK